MENNHPPILDTIDIVTLTPIIRKSLKFNDFQILNWSVHQLGGGAGNPVSFGLYRFEGIGLNKNEKTPWSIILKIIQSPANVGAVNLGEGDDPSHWNYWRREQLVYQSGFLNQLPDGFIAPRFISSSELPGNFICLWLEDIADENKQSWSLERYALTARHLGRFNGSTVNKGQKPVFPWLSRNRTRSWIDLMPWNNFSWEDPIALRRYQYSNQNFFKQLLIENQRFLAKLDEIPQTVSHGDTYPTNFKSRKAINGREETVALDWALMGVTPFGDDLGQFVFGAITNLETEDPLLVDRVLFESYMDGLKDVGCQIDRQLVRFGYTASAGFRVGLFQIFLMTFEIEKNLDHGQQIKNQSPSKKCFEEMMAEEAFDLYEKI